MGLLLDSNILIRWERSGLDLGAHTGLHGGEAVFLSAVTASELLHGVHRATDPAVRGRRASWVEAVLDRFPVLPVDLATARAHARLWAHLMSRGELIGPHDLWIAATALRHGLTLATANRREFDRVPGLVVEDWAG